tara:strand:+ start:294 stop:410 length:117 start_codon:yes stop_codon:yes gene_type:complete
MAFVFKVLYIIMLKFFGIDLFLIKKLSLPPPKKADSSG